MKERKQNIECKVSHSNANKINKEKKQSHLKKIFFIKVVSRKHKKGSNKNFAGNDIKEFLVGWEQIIKGSSRKKWFQNG